MFYEGRIVIFPAFYFPARIWNFLFEKYFLNKKFDGKEFVYIFAPRKGVLYGLRPIRLSVRTQDFHS